MIKRPQVTVTHLETPSLHLVDRLQHRANLLSVVSDNWYVECVHELAIRLDGRFNPSPVLSDGVPVIHIVAVDVKREQVLRNAVWSVT